MRQQPDGVRLTESHGTPFLSDARAVCPPDLIARAAGKERPVAAVAGAGSRLPLAAVQEAAAAGIITPLLFGDSASINAEAEALEWDISAYDVVHAPSETAAAEAAVGACREESAQLLMKGHVHTDILMRAVLDRRTGLRTGDRLVHVFYLTHPSGGRGLAISDAAVNVAPDLETREAAARHMVRLFHRLDVAVPRIAFLSATETPLPSVPSSVEGRTLRDRARAEIAGAEFSGPLALDLVLSRSAAGTKGLDDDPVAGKADGIIVPDIVSGNALYKALVHVAGACSAGVVNGARVPILLTSRADPAAARLASVALAAVLCDA